MTAQVFYPARRCRDADAMIRWLGEAFGFAEGLIVRDGAAVTHAELHFDGAILMLGQARDDEWGRLTKDVGGGSLYVATDDPDALAARAAAAGAEIVRPLRDTGYGSREFACRDPEGWVWSFGTYRPAPA